jgi:hypothetical protein
LIKSMTMGKLFTVRNAEAASNRSVQALFHACRITSIHLGRVLRQLWLEVTGLVFLVLAFTGVVTFFREYGKYKAGTGNFDRAAIAICFTFLFGWFGISSFWRVRKTNTSR